MHRRLDSVPAVLTLLRNDRFPPRLLIAPLLLTGIGSIARGPGDRPHGRRDIPQTATRPRRSSLSSAQSLIDSGRADIVAGRPASVAHLFLERVAATPHG